MSADYYYYYYYYYYLVLQRFSYQRQLMVFHWCLSESNFLQASMTLLIILAVLNNAVVWMVSTHPPTYKSSCPFNSSLVTVPKAPITIDTIVTLMFLNFFNSLARLRYLSFFSISFSFNQWSAGIAMSTILQIAFFYHYKICSSGGHYSARSVCLILRDRYWVVHKAFIRMVKFKFLAHLPVDHLTHPVESSLILLPS